MTQLQLVPPFSGAIENQSAKIASSPEKTSYVRNMEPFFIGSYEDIVAHHEVGGRVSAEKIRPLTDMVREDWNLSREEKLMMIVLYEIARGDYTAEASIETIDRNACIGRTDAHAILKSLEAAGYLRIYAKKRNVRYVALRRTTRELGARPAQWKPFGFKRPRSESQAAIESATANAMSTVRPDIRAQLNAQKAGSESNEIELTPSAMKVKVSVSQAPKKKEKAPIETIEAAIRSCRDSLRDPYLQDAKGNDRLVLVVEHAIKQAQARIEEGNRKRTAAAKESGKQAPPAKKLELDAQLRHYWQPVVTMRENFGITATLQAVEETVVKKQISAGSSPTGGPNYKWHSYARAILERQKRENRLPADQVARIASESPTDAAEKKIKALLKQAAHLADTNGDDSARFALRDQAVALADQVADKFGGDRELAYKSIREAVRQGTEHFVGIKPQADWLYAATHDYDPTWSWDGSAVPA
jgi:hypothetical protein